MKHLVSIILGVVLTAAFTGCGGPSGGSAYENASEKEIAEFEAMRAEADAKAAAMEAAANAADK